MWDKSHPNSFEKIPDLVNVIISMIKEHIIGTIDIFLVQSKSDLEFDISGEGQPDNEIQQKIEELKNKYINLNQASISLVNKDGIFDLLLDIVRNQNPANFDKNDVVNLVKIKYPMKSVNNNEKTVNICLVGNPKTGKTTFLKKLLEENEYNKIIRDKLEPDYAVLISNEKILVKISEVPGNNMNFIRNCHGFLLFFDVTDKDSLKYLEEWTNLIKEKGNDDIIIVGNKIDDREKRQIKKGEVKLFATKENCKYFECSCLVGINVLEIFNEIVYDAYQIFTQFNSSRMSFGLRKEENIIQEKKTIEKKGKTCGC
jgi:small GTP-binding protein